VSDRAEKKEPEKKEPDRKDLSAKDAEKREAEKKNDGVDMARVFQFTIDCDYNKPRAEGDKPASTPQAK